MQARPELRLDALDADWRAIEALARPVSREIHKMHAFVRFRTTQRQNQPDLHIAWFEPEHHIVRAAAQFFCKRFATCTGPSSRRNAARTGIGHALRLTPGARRSDAPPADAGEALCADLLRQHLKPARLKEQGHAARDAAPLLAQPARGRC